MDSGKFIIRMDRHAHTLLKLAAHRQGISMNDLCVRRLMLPGADAFPSAILSAVGVLTRIAGDELCSMAIFGSWARGEANAQSDIDILVVLKSGTKIHRGLYRHWEQNSISEDTPIAPHFVTLPSPEASVSGLWAEVALDAVVLADASLQLQHYLQFIRQLIAQGKLVRKRAHGQNYWLHNEVA